ncbi:MAG: TIGR00341 family protein, partial [Theionarchaea archaeon]|nr:TIGR00341 family protein [Theionarchaea archaeon]
MKKVVATTQKEDLDKIHPLLEGTLHSLEREDDLIRITVYVHDNELDDIVDALEKIIDMRYKKSMIEVYTPDFIISSFLERSKEKAEESEEKPIIEELIDSTRPHLTLDVSEIALVTIAGVIALTGLFMNSVAIIIGAMLLSPLLGPIHAFTINTAVGKVKDVLKCILNLGIMLLMVIGFSFLTTLVISPYGELSLTPEILARMDSSFIYIFMALLLGFASIFALSRNISESMAGVAIAAALLPPAAVTGICLVLYPSRAINSLVLPLENVFGLMAGGLCATFLLDIRPRRYYEQVVARKVIFRTAVV